MEKNQKLSHFVTLFFQQVRLVTVYAHGRSCLVPNVASGKLGLRDETFATNEVRFVVSHDLHSLDL
jgi:hypothetical protein